MRRVQRELSHQLGKQPSRIELAEALGMESKDLEDLISQSAPCASLDAHARGEEDRSTLGELIPDPNSDEPMEGMDRKIQKRPIGENNINIDVVLANSAPIGIDTEKDYIEIKKLMEYKL